MSRRGPLLLQSGAAGLLFGIGLALSKMTRPEKVLAFLDLRGSWDPSLAFVMLGAIAVHALAQRSARAQPVFSERFSVPVAAGIDRRLIGGAALFGVGWGWSGYCPGPALGSLTTGSGGSLVFVTSMLLGMAAVAGVDAARARRRQA